MAFKDTLLSEFDMEMDNTRRALERVPDGKFGWKPHEKSGTLGWMATHIATIPHWAKMTMEQESLDLSPAGGSEFVPPKADTRKELLDLFDKNRAEARAALAGGDDVSYAKSWALLMGGRELFREPRSAVLRRMVFNHIIHHRGQLTMYLRLLDVPVPALYGPSADEQKF
ncbi:MAG TPA: DinB family protein [Terriglobales bacterium]|nr:DinB family protein [Terriglobales bacterium]